MNRSGAPLSLALDAIDDYMREHADAANGASVAVPNAEALGMFATNGHRLMALREVRDRIVRAGIKWYELSDSPSNEAS